MKLVTFKVHTESRIGAVAKEGIVDLNSAYAAYLREAGEPFPRRAASAVIPPDMVGFLEGGEKSKKEAEKVLKWVAKKKGALGVDGEKLVRPSGHSLLAGLEHHQATVGPLDLSGLTEARH